MLFAKTVACWLPALGVPLLAYRKGEARAKWVSVMAAYQDSPGKNNPCLLYSEHAQVVFLSDGVKACRGSRSSPWGWRS